MIPDPDMKIVPDRDMRLGGAGRAAPEGFVRRYLPKLGGLAGQIVPSVAATVLGAYIVANYVNGKPAPPAQSAVQSPGPAVSEPAAPPAGQAPKASVLQQLPAPVQTVIEALRPEPRAASREEPKTAEIKPAESAAPETKPAEQIRVIPLTPAKTEARRPPEKGQDKSAKAVRREPAKTEPKVEAKVEPKPENKTDVKPEPRIETRAFEPAGPEPVKPEPAPTAAAVPVPELAPKSEARLPAAEVAPVAGAPASDAAVTADAILMARRALDRMRAEPAAAPEAAPGAEASAAPAEPAIAVHPGPPQAVPPQPAARIVDAPYRAPAPVREEATAVPALPPPVIVADPDSRRLPPPQPRRRALIDPDRPVPPADIPGVEISPGFVLVR